MKRMFACLIILAAFPLLASPTHSKSDNAVPFAAVAFAGHVTTAGVYCDCTNLTAHTGGESIEAVLDQTDSSLDHADSPVSEASDSELDFDFGALMLAFALFVGTRLRA